MGPTSFFLHLPSVLLTSGLRWLFQLLSLLCIPASGTENNTSIWNWHIVSTQIPRAEVSSLSWQTWEWWIHRRAGECDPTTEHSWWVTRANTLHSCPCNSFFFGSPHTAFSLFLPADMNTDESVKEEMGLAVQIWRKQEKKEDKKL